MDILHIFIILCFAFVIISVVFRLIAPTNDRKEDGTDRLEEETRREKEERNKKIDQEYKKAFGNIRGSWLGKTRQGLVEVVFDDEKSMMIIQNETDVLSLTYRFVSLDEEIILEVNDGERISQASLRHMSDGRLHFKSSQLEMVLSKRE